MGEVGEINKNRSVYEGEGTGTGFVNEVWDDNNERTNLFVIKENSDGQKMLHEGMSQICA